MDYEMVDMVEHEHDEDYGRAARLWRIEQHQIDIIQRLERLQNRIDENISRREAHEWRTEQILTMISTQAAELLKRQALSGGLSGPISDWAPIVKIVLAGLLGTIITLAIGKAFVFPG